MLFALARSLRGSWRLVPGTHGNFTSFGVARRRDGPQLVIAGFPGFCLGGAPLLVVRRRFLLIRYLFEPSALGCVYALKPGWFPLMHVQGHHKSFPILVACQDGPRFAPKLVFCGIFVMEGLPCLVTCLVLFKPMPGPVLRAPFASGFRWFF